ncbi:MAG: polysaccharide deacetylase family protein [Bacteriovorax sp.]
MKKIFKHFLSKSRLLRMAKDQNHLMILNYHRLSDPYKKNLFDDGVFGPDAKRFESEMRWLKEETHIISEEELVDIIYNKKKLNRVCSMVTFDDGYIDNFEIAYPILNKLSIPAIYFIPTKFINERTLGWWDIISYIVKNTKLERIHFREKEWTIINKQNVISELILKIKKMETSRIDGYLNELSLAFDVPIPSIDIQGKELMSWDQIKEVNCNGISIGSHSHEHVILSKQALGDLRLQVKKSKDILEEKLGTVIQSIAYPVGGHDHFDIETKNVSLDLGFKLGFSFLTGVNRFESIDPFDVKRGTSQADWSNLDLALAFPDRFFQPVRTE